MESSTGNGEREESEVSMCEKLTFKSIHSGKTPEKLTAAWRVSASVTRSERDRAIVGYGRCKKSWGGRRKNVGKGKKKKIPPLYTFVQRHGYVGGLGILFTERTSPVTPSGI
jgi:hypothetical protein